jgi:FAD/FMN-containing dehydrogenase
MNTQQNVIHPDFLSQARDLLGAEHVLTEGDSGMAAFITPARYAAGAALAVLRPATTAQVADVLRLISQNGLRAVAQGAHTGLTRAGTPQQARRDVVVDTTRLRSVLEIDADHRTLRASTGFRLSDVNAALAPHGLWLAIDLSADPTIGGMLASNTGGTRLLRYGDVRRNTLGLTAVLAHPAGEVVSWHHALPKNNTGLDLKQLFIGSSGSFGITTEAVMRVHRLPLQRAVALIAPQNISDVVPLCLALEHAFAESLSAMEGMSREAMESALQHVPSLRRPFLGATPEYSVLVELSLAIPSSLINLEQALQDFLEQRFETQIADAVLDSSERLWHVRHAISESLRARGAVLGFDLSLRRADLMAFRTQAIALLQQHFPDAVVADFGHLGDGGVHFNIVWPHSAPPLSPTQRADLRRLVFDLAVHPFNGVFSAEHGIGPSLQDEYDRYTPLPIQQLAQRIENTLDPAHLCGLTRFGIKP